MRRVCCVLCTSPRRFVLWGPVLLRATRVYADTPPRFWLSVRAACSVAVGYVLPTSLRRFVSRRPVSLRATRVYATRPPLLAFCVRRVWCRRGLRTPRLPAALRFTGAPVVSCDAGIRRRAPFLAFCARAGRAA
ncbi:hypothetical protein C8J57DRAFT_1332975 [Mycena rebaudengoi]|nr:hypothetical protein C8J57DRAFT_1332975 [Mycena rebaudengoi]